jgi:hypothetical protein
MRILCGALQGGVFLGRNGGFERRAGLLPAGAEIVLAGTAEAVLRQLRGAETDETQQLRLLVGGRCAARPFEVLRQGDRGNVVARPGGPAVGRARSPARRKLLPRAAGLGAAGGISPS